MAYQNISDMYARRLFLAALQSLPSRVNSCSLTLNDIAGLSTYDRPASKSLEENEFYKKYEAKLSKLKNEKPVEFESAVDDVYKSRQSKVTEKKNPSDIRGSSLLDSMNKTSRAHESEEVKKAERHSLHSILKMDLICDKTSSEISAIWNEYFANKEGHIFATIPAEKYQRLKMKGLEHPIFLYALPRDSGYEFVLGQCLADDWHYTPLISYQTHGEYAPYCLAVHYYTELASSKGIVLMKGEVASKDVKPELATLLVHETQLVYGNDDNFELVKTMHSKPNEFKHMDVISLYKKCGLF